MKNKSSKNQGSITCRVLEKAIAPHSSTLENPMNGGAWWAAISGRGSPWSSCSSPRYPQAGTPRTTTHTQATRPAHLPGFTILQPLFCFRWPEDPLNKFSAPSPSPYHSRWKAHPQFGEEDRFMSISSRLPPRQPWPWNQNLEHLT